MAAVLIRGGGGGNVGARAFSRALKLLLLLLLFCPSRLADVTGSTHCPSVNFSIPEGSSGMILSNVSRNPNLILLHKNIFSTHYDFILSIFRKDLNFYNSKYKGYFSIRKNGLFIENTSKDLAGEYQFADHMSKVCVNKVFLSVLGSMNCSSRNFSILAGPSEMIIPNISTKYDDRLVLYRKNHSTSALQLILSITEEGLIFSTGAYEGCFNVSNNGLTFKNGCDGLPGEYLLWRNGSCVLKLFLNRPDPWHCPSANFSIPEGSSGMIMPNISIHSNRLALYKQNHSSSSGQYILSIAKGHLNHIVGTYEKHFYISDSGLYIKNAYEGLTGEYQLVYWQNKSCVLLLFLNISVSGRSHVYAFPAVGSVGTLVLCFLVYLCWKQKRKDNRTAQPAHGSANGTLLPFTNSEESRADLPTRENGNSFPPRNGTSNKLPL